MVRFFFTNRGRLRLMSVSHSLPTFCELPKISHTDQAWIDLVRDDNSTYHAADYDPETGELVDQGVQRRDC